MIINLENAQEKIDLEETVLKRLQEGIDAVADLNG